MPLLNTVLKVTTFTSPTSTSFAIRNELQAGPIFELTSQVIITTGTMRAQCYSGTAIFTKHDALQCKIYTGVSRNSMTKGRINNLEYAGLLRSDCVIPHLQVRIKTFRLIGNSGRWVFYIYNSLESNAFVDLFCGDLTCLMKTSTRRTGIAITYSAGFTG